MTFTPQAPVKDRRLRERNTYDDRAAGLIQALLTNPVKVANELEADLQSGADPIMTAALLAGARMFGDLRGIDLTGRIAVVVKRLQRVGFGV
jgi:hypothetical protein